MTDKSLTNQLLGYGLLFLGIFIMFFSSLQVYLVFTKRVSPVRFFNFPPITFDAASLVPQVGERIDLSQFVNLPGMQGVDLSRLQQNDTKVQPKQFELFSAAMLNDPANLGATVFLYGFVLNVGYKLAGLGVQLVRVIVVRAG
jgi:hypothetical protein